MRKMDTTKNAMGNTAQNKTTAAPAAKVDKPKIVRKPPIKYGTISKVERLVREGKGTFDEIVMEGVSEKEARLAIRKLKSEGIVKESLVIVNQ